IRSKNRLRIEELRQKLRAHLPTVIQTIRDLMRPEVEDRVRLDAAKLALAYLYGSPAPVELPTSSGSQVQIVLTDFSSRSRDTAAATAVVSSPEIAATSESPSTALPSAGAPTPPTHRQSKFPRSEQ